MYQQTTAVQTVAPIRDCYSGFMVKVFEKGIGKPRGMKARIDVDSTKLLQCLTHYILKKMQNKSLEASSILSKVESSDWAMPIVPVIKKGKAGAVHILYVGILKWALNLFCIQYSIACYE